MKRFLGYAAAAVALALLAGCGGSSSLGKNSAILVHLLRTDGTQDMTQFEIYVTRNGATNFNLADFESYGSTTNHPSWMDVYSATRSTTDLDLGFTTRSNQPPYFIFVKVPNTGAAFETLKLRIEVDSNAGPDVTYNFPITATTQIGGAIINRNSASY